VREAYQTFLRSADLPVWNSCLAAYTRVLESSPEALPDDELVEGMVISLYVQWLSSVSGDLSCEESSRRESVRFVDALDSRHRHDPSAATKRGWAIVLGWRGYRALARQLVWEAVEPAASGRLAGKEPSGVPRGVGPEVALIMITGEPGRRAAQMRPYVSALGGDVFPPALWEYCESLLRLGAVRQVDALLKNSGLPSSSPLRLDLLGQIHERSGRWRDAMAVYGAPTSWPIHRYRAAVCAAVAGQRTEESVVLDDAFVRSLSPSETEIDQGEIARSAAFVNACMWNAFDDWIVEFELGKLDFRRRRYAEADVHLKHAVDRAPGPCKAAIASLRSSNLTWLSDSSWWADLLASLNMRPEALERTMEALEMAGEGSGLRIWLAIEAEEPELLPPSIENCTPYDQALAHNLVGNRPEAIGARIKCLEMQYNHRNITALIDVFRSARFHSSCEYLTKLIIRESRDDFFPLWELAHGLFSALGLYGESSQEFSRVSELLEATSERMMELAKFEFQHLLRAHEFFRKAGRQDIAESLLRRAADLAEGPADCLAIAVARRRLPWFNSADVDPQARSVLEQAGRESRDRLERMQIAREHFHQGQIQQARQMLEEEGLFDERQRFEHIEYVIGLQCGRWLKPEEFASLARRATDALADDIKTGKIRRFGSAFLRRLRTSIRLVDPDLAQRLGRSWVSPQEDGDTAKKSPKGLAAGPSKQWGDAMQALREGDDAEREQEAFLKKVTELQNDWAFEESLATWARAQDQVYEALDTAFAAEPDDKDEPRPISKTLTLEDDARAFELCNLWRQALDSDDSTRSRARAGIRAFYLAEDELIQRWDERRRRKAEKPLRRALFYVDKSCVLLDVLEAGLEGTTHPVLQGLSQVIREDCQRQRERCASIVRAIQSELSPRVSP
jgi:hypothetical protein